MGIVEAGNDIWIVRELDEFDAIKEADGVSLGIGVVVAVVNLLHAIGAEHLGAAAAGFRGARNELDVSTGKKRTKVDLGVKHEFAACIPIKPELVIRIESGGEPVVSGADDSVVKIECHGTHLAEGVLGTQTGNMSKCHGVFRNAETDALIAWVGAGHGSVMLLVHTGLRQRWRAVSGFTIKSNMDCSLSWNSLKMRL